MALIVLTSTVGALGATAGGPLAEVTVVRYGGEDRFETSVATTTAYSDFKGGAIVDVTMVSGHKWHDAVVAAPFDVPVVLTRRHAVPEATLDFLKRVDTEFVRIISTDTISPAVDRQLEQAGIEVLRIEGSDQFRTSVAVARHFGFVGQFRGKRTAVVASGQVFADALVVGPLSARENLPILLTPPHGLHSELKAYLTSMDVEQVMLMGGTEALSVDVEEAIEELDIEVWRIAGETRFETAVKVARLSDWSCFSDDGGFGVGLSRAWLPYDAFSAAPMLARHRAPMLLAHTDELPAVTMDYLDEARVAQTRCASEPLSLLVIGGEAAVSSRAIDAYLKRDTEIPTADD